MNNVELVRSPSMIAEEINAIKSQTSGILAAALTYAKRSCFEIGKRLEEAKALVPHGEWGAWLESNFEYSESTAGNLMRIYREYGNEQVNMLTGKSDAETFEGLTQSQLVELFALPKPMRADFVETHREELENGDLSIREMRDLIKAQKEELDKKDAVIAQKDKEILENDESYGELVTQLRAAEAEQLRLSEENAKAADAVNEAEEKAREADERASRANEELEAIRNAPKETITETVTETVYAPTAEQIDKIREDAFSEAEQKHADALAKKDEDHKKEMQEAQEDTAKKIRQLLAKSDPHTARVSYAMEAIQRALSDINAEISAMEQETPGSGQKMRNRCESMLLGIINRAGWQV